MGTRKDREWRRGCLRETVFLLAFALSLCGVLVSPRAARGDTDYKYFHGERIRWGERELDLCVMPSATAVPEVEEALEWAAALWAQVPDVPQVTVYRTRDLGAIGLTCEIRVELGPIPQKFDFEPLAVNTLTVFDNAEVNYTVITINPYHLHSFGDATLSRWRYDLKGILAHELGHALGLEEENESRDGIMWSTFDRGMVKRTLRPSDIRSLRRLYRGQVLR